jgi:anti-sigma B factor antagonist
VRVLTASTWRTTVPTRVHPTWELRHLPNGSASPRFVCEVHREQDLAIVAPAGELDLATRPRVEQQLAELRAAGYEHLVVDLRELEFMDCAGVGMLLEWSESAGIEGTRFSVITNECGVHRVLQLAGAGDALERLAEPRAAG